MSSQGFHEDFQTHSEFIKDYDRNIANKVEESEARNWHSQHDEEIEHAWENAERLLDYYLH